MPPNWKSTHDSNGASSANALAEKPDSVTVVVTALSETPSKHRGTVLRFLSTLYNVHRINMKWLRFKRKKK